MRWLAAALLALAAVLNVTAASAGSRRVAVLRPDDELLRALSLALAPWGLEIVRSDAPMPHASQPEAVRAALRLARQLNAEAVIWVSSVAEGSLLWVFDVPGKDVTTRLIEQTSPFDSAAAAAVALSVKTVLRESFVAPREERLGATPLEPRTQRRSALELGAGGQWLADDAFDLRLELAAVVWLLSARNLGLSAVVSWGPGVRIDGPSYRGRYRELAVGGRTRLRVVRTRALSLALSAGASAHFTTLAGTHSPDLRESNAERVNATFDLSTSIHVDLSRALYLGASLGGAYSPVYRRYLVAGTPIFSPWPVTATVATHLGMELF